MKKGSRGQREISAKGVKRTADVIRSRSCEFCLLCGAKGIILHQRLRDGIFGTPGEWNLKRCPDGDCGLVWLDPMPIEKDIMIAYKDYYTHLSGGASKPPSFRRNFSGFLDECYLRRKYGYGQTASSPAWMRFLGLHRSLQPLRSAALDFKVMYLPALPGGRLLEIGCGGGDNLKTLQEMGWVAEGLDFDAKAVENARKKGLIVRQGTLETQGYSHDCFDAIVMSHLIEHVFDPLSIFRECKRILKPSGRLVIVTPNISSLGHRVFGAGWRPLEPPRHLHLFSAQALSALASRAGFKDHGVFSTVREANNVFIASRDIKRSGRHVWGSRQPWGVRKSAKIMAVLEKAILAFSPFIGEEIVLVAQR